MFDGLSPPHTQILKGTVCSGLEFKKCRKTEKNTYNPIY
jgi:hypothetical protein